jgi:hypothetical protein
MSDKTNGFHSSLPAELVAALAAATAKNLGALDSLRKTLRLHVHNERNRGVTLAEINRDMAQMLAGAEQNAHRSPGAHGDSELRAQMTNWIAAFFRGTG